MKLSLVRVVGTFDRGLVAAETVGEETGNAPDGRYTDPCEIVNFPVGQALLQVLDDLPAIHEGLELRRGTQILEETATFVDRLEAAHRRTERVFSTCLLAGCFVAIGLHDLCQCNNVLVH
mgnify:CR=1 FL=1